MGGLRDSGVGIPKSDDDQTLKAPAVPKSTKGTRLPGVKGKAFKASCKHAGRALARSR
jgi:hypothetical protein